ncbi:MAG: hypothetical protein HN757_15560, partial [Calditrichaeota bacterium]|nr:hypothetical protein [Calditrichota bacterium]
MSLLGKNKKKENIKKSRAKDKQVKHNIELVEEVEEKPIPLTSVSLEEENEGAQKQNGVRSDTNETSENIESVDVDEKIKRLEAD